MVLLSFDVEEFDYPEELGIKISEERKIQVSSEGLEKILKVLSENNVKATFFCTAFFAQRARGLMEQIVNNGHEIASHGYNHSSFDTSDLLRSRISLEDLTGQKVRGYRMARMQPVKPSDIAAAGYQYDSSLNPLFIPGRYNNWDKPRTWHPVSRSPELIEIPASVSPVLRLPMFWLALHHYPLSLYQCLANRILRRDGYLVIYFHPWEFADIQNLQEGRLPWLVTRNSGETEQHRLDKLIKGLKRKGYGFGTISDYLGLNG